MYHIRIPYSIHLTIYFEKGPFLTHNFLTYIGMNKGVRSILHNIYICIFLLELGQLGNRRGYKCHKASIQATLRYQ